MMEREERRERWDALLPRIVIGRVQRGRWRPEQAEAWATRSGLPSFTCEPPPGEHEPANEPWWTAAMVTAWITWRTYEAVRHHSHAFRAASMEWHRISGAPVFANGFDLRAKQALSASDVLASLWPERRLVDQSNTVREALGDALRAEKVKAFGLRSGEVVPREIAAHEWLALSPFSRPTRGQPVHDAIYPQEGTAPAFYSVRFRRAEIAGMWKSTPVGPRKKPGPDDAKRRAIEAAMREYGLEKLADDDRSGALSVLRLWTMFKQHGGKTLVWEVWQQLRPEIDAKG